MYLLQLSIASLSVFPTHDVDQTPARRVARSLLSTHAHVSLIWSSSCQFRRTRVRVMISAILITGVSVRCPSVMNWTDLL